MELYTKQQLLDLITAAYYAGVHNDQWIFEKRLKNISPIEVPSDEQIVLQAGHYENYNEFMSDLQAEKSSSKYHGFIEGAKWIRDKIK